MKGHVDPLSGVIVPCPVCVDSGVPLCSAEDLRRQGWDAAIEAAARRVEQSFGAWSSHGHSVACDIRAIKYDLDGGSQ